MNWKSLLLSCAILFQTHIAAGEIDIHGKVTDISNNGIQNVTVSLVNADLETKTDSDGDYYLQNGVFLTESVQKQGNGISLHNNKIQLSSSAGASVTIELYSVNGQRCAKIFDGVVSSGIKSFSLDQVTLSNGIYLLSISVNGKRSVYRQSLIGGSFSGIGKRSGISMPTIGNSGARGDIDDTLVFAKEGMDTIRIPLTSYEGQFDTTMVEEVIITSPSITKDIEDQTVTADETVEFSLEVEGEDLEYVWYVDNEEVEGDGNTLSFKATKRYDGSEIFCVVKNSAGADKSRTAVLKVQDALSKPVIIENPSDVTVKTGESAAFSVQATGDSLTYTWYKNSAKQSGKNSSYSFTAQMSDNNAEIFCIVANSAGADTSAVAMLTIDDGTVTIPTSFTKKSVLEYGTGTWCKYCPLGAETAHELEERYHDRMYVVAIHSGDVFEVPEGRPMLQEFGCSGYPSGALDRIPYGGEVFYSRNDWSYQASSIMSQKSTSCGLKLESTSSSVTVTAGFNQSQSNVGLIVVLLESGIANSNQSGAGSGYLQNHCLREVLTDDLIDGDNLSGSTGSEEKTYSFSTSGYNSSNCTLLAYIVKRGSNSQSYEILNAQAVALGSSKEFD